MKYKNDSQLKKKHKNKILIARLNILKFVVQHLRDMDKINMKIKVFLKIAESNFFTGCSLNGSTDVLS